MADLVQHRLGHEERQGERGGRDEIDLTGSALSRVEAGTDLVEHDVGVDDSPVLHVRRDGREVGRRAKIMLTHDWDGRSAAALEHRGPRTLLHLASRGLAPESGRRLALSERALL